MRGFRLAVAPGLAPLGFPRCSGAALTGVLIRWLSGLFGPISSSARARVPLVGSSRIFCLEGGGSCVFEHNFCGFKPSLILEGRVLFAASVVLSGGVCREAQFYVLGLVVFSWVSEVSMAPG